MEVIFLAFKDYFKFKDSNNQIYVVRNLGEDSKELFTNILNESNRGNKINSLWNFHKGRCCYKGW